jgi:3-isopropylmalate/(R)-2-methylmalate dehydratase small subunit
MTVDDGHRRGRCYKFGDNIPLDNAIMPVRFAVTHVFDVATLLPHLFSGLRPGFAEEAKRGDFIVAGRSFCAGKAHPQGLIAIAHLGLAILCESMPFNAYRGAVSRGVLCNRNCQGVLELVDDGDDLEMNYATGHFINHTRNLEHDFPPIEGGLLGMMTGGGMYGMLRRWREESARRDDVRSGE